jgi:hypothetical protein
LGLIIAASLANSFIAAAAQTATAHSLQLKLQLSKGYSNSQLYNDT